MLENLCLGGNNGWSGGCQSQRKPNASLCHSQLRSTNNTHTKRFLRPLSCILCHIHLPIRPLFFKDDQHPLWEVTFPYSSRAASTGNWQLACARAHHRRARCSSALGPSLLPMSGSQPSPSRATCRLPPWRTRHCQTRILAAIRHSPAPSWRGDGAVSGRTPQPAHTVAELASARQHQENPADHHGARGGG